MVLALRCGRNVSEESFALVQLGMTEAEVETILGGPAEYYGHTSFFSFNGCFGGIVGEWRTGDKVIAVSFVEGKAVVKRMMGYFNPSQQPPSPRGVGWRLKHWALD